MRAVIYVRISQDRAGTELGVDRQRNDCLALARRRGWDVVEVFTENDTSAAAGKKRPQWERMMRLIEDEGADVVIGWTVDRTLRSGRDRLRILELGKERNLLISLVRGSDMDLGTPSGRLAADILGAVALNEIEAKSDRQKAANAQAAAAGRRVGGRRPFGYEQDGMTLIPREADAIRDAYSLILCGGSLTGVAREWNARGLHSGQTAWKGERRAQPTQWSNRTVGRVLLNPRYAGLRRHGEVIVGSAVWPAVVPEETWRAAVAILTDPTRLHKPHTARRLLTNLARCGVCGQLVHGGGASHGKPIYRCKTGRHINRLSDPVDHWVGLVVVRRLSMPDAAELLVASPARPDVAALRAEAHGIRVRLDTLGVEFADGVLTPSQMRTITTRLRTKLAELEAEMVDAGRVDVLGPLVAAADVAAVWAGCGIDRRRAVIDTLMEVRLLPVGTGARGFNPDTVQITWRTAADDDSRC